ncbi:MAG: RES domain-containing protein [Sphingomonadales bacterium]|nr:MAG: RES domain-containing protein [Sphingomonadales bacterium]
MDEPNAFASWRSYWHFRREVASRRRYLLSDESKAFLAELARTAASRARRLPEGRQFCRAQVAHKDREDPDAGPLPGPAPLDRMMPRPDAASDGRANPEGIPRLYMAGDRHTAIAEVRPWIGSLVTVAFLKTLRDLRVVDCRETEVKPHWFLDEEPSPAEREEAVWAEVAAAFREPVLRGDDRAGYAPTQVIAELFQQHGFDGIAYGSGFGDKAVNVVLFDTTAAEMFACEIHEVRGVKLDHETIDNPFPIRRNEDGELVMFRTVIDIIGPVGTPLPDVPNDDEEKPEG